VLSRSHQPCKPKLHFNVEATDGCSRNAASARHMQFMNESRRLTLLNTAEHVGAYEEHNRVEVRLQLN